MQEQLPIVAFVSRNGTFVDGQKLSPLTPDKPHDPVSLKRRSKVKLGNLEFEVIIDE